MAYTPPNDERERDYLQRITWEAEKKMACAKEWNGVVEQRNAQLDNLCGYLRGQVDNLKLELSQTEQGWTKLAGEKRLLQGQLQSVKKALKASSVEGKRLQYEVQTITANRDDFQTYSENLAKEKKKLEDCIKQLQEANQASNGEHVNLSHQWKEEKAKYEQMVEELNEALETSSLECARLQKKVSQLDSEVLTITTSRNEFQTRCQILANKEKELEKTLEASSVEGRRLQYEVQTITASRYHFQTVSKNLAEEKKKLEESLRSTTYKGELAASRGKVEGHDEAKETFQKDLNVLTEAKTRAEKEIEKMTHIVKYLKEEAKTKDEDYRELESKYKVLEDGRENPQLTEKLEDAKLKLQKAQSELENEQRNCELEKDTTKHLRTEIAQLNHSLSSQEKEVQALKNKGSHRREVMQQVVKLLQAQVAAVRSDLDQERSGQSDLKDSVEQLLTRSFTVKFLKTELVSRAAELQKCRDELKTTTAERDRLRHTIAMKQYMDQQFHRLQEQMTRNLVQIVTKVIAGVHEVSAGVSELNKEVQQLQDQTSSTSSVQQSLTAPAPVSKNLTEDGTRPQEMLCMSQPPSGVPNALVKVYVLANYRIAGVMPVLIAFDKLRVVKDSPEGGCLRHG